MAQIYDDIGTGYTRTRHPDPRIEAIVHEALGDARTIVNVGAGTGSYEPADRRVVAVEPSSTMIAQRPAGAAPVVQASATDLPFGDGAFDAAMGVLTVHHWPDRERGLRELERVSRDGVAVLTWDPEHPGFWLVRDYVPEVLEIDKVILPSMEVFRRALGPIASVPVPIPHDCVDGFLGAYWRRPRAYLDPEVQRRISTFAKVPALERRLERLAEDIEDGTWERRHGELTGLEACDIGYRLVVSGRLAERSRWEVR